MKMEWNFESKPKKLHNFFQGCNKKFRYRGRKWKFF